MKTLTPADAREQWECPMARTFAKPETRFCRGDTCAAWRFLKLLASDPAFQTAVQREVALLKEETGKSADGCHKQAVARVAADPSAYNIPGHHERGYCGLGGPP
jgi:hypothetical protein